MEKKEIKKQIGDPKANLTPGTANSLPLLLHEIVDFADDKLDKSDVSDSEGSSETKVMTQKAVTDALAGKLDTPPTEGETGQVLQKQQDGTNGWVTIQGEGIIPDAAIDGTSGNAVENKVIKQYVDTSLSTKTDQEQAGEKKYDEETITLPTPNTGGAQGPNIIGNSPNISTSTGYRYYIISVSPGALFDVHTYLSDSGNYQRYVLFVDTNNKIVGRSPESTYQEGWITYTLQAPAGSVSMYVTTKYSSTILPQVYVKKKTIISLQSQIDAITPVGTVLSKTSEKPISTKTASTAIIDNKFSNNATLLEEETSRLWIRPYLNNLYDTSEAIGYNALVAKVDARSGLKFALCSDTHHGGAYATKPSNPMTAERSIRVFNKLTQSNKVAAAIHGGDISCDYGTSARRILSFSRTVIEKFDPLVPFLITKGNHDENNDIYSEVNLLDVDFSKENYYVRSFNTYTQVTEATWDGAPLYRVSYELVTDAEFKRLVQKYRSPVGAVWGNGAYYYADFATYKVRVIVLNSFPVDDTTRTVVEGYEYKWFAETALDLSEKETPSDWAVLVLRHSTAVGLTLFSDIVTAFKTGGSVSGTKDGVSWSKDYSSQGNGTFIAVLHGHEHEYTYSNADGVHDIGFTMSNCKVSELGDSTKYGISVVTIDTTNKVIYDDQISGTTRQYEY